MQMTQIRAQRYCVHKAGRAKCSVTDVLNQALKVLPAVLTHTLHSQPVQARLEIPGESKARHRDLSCQGQLS